MANNLIFDTSALEALIDKHGIRRTWVNILATHIVSHGEKYFYMLESDEFKDHTILEDNLILSLSVGEIGVLYEFSVAYVDAGSRKVNGQFFTPDDVALFMVSKAVEFEEGVWLDPCSGIGNLSWHLVNKQQDPENFMLNNMVLSDKDPLALFIARCIFTISFQNKVSDFFLRIQNRFVELDFLSVSSGYSQGILDSNDISEIPAHDFVIVNPPYLSIKGADHRFETGKCRDLYAYFLENIIKSSKGFVSITPQSFTNASKFESLRTLLLRNYQNLKIYTFDNIPGNIFSGVKFGSSNSNTANSIRACIMVAIKDQSGAQPKITSLLRWKTAERADFMGHLDDFLCQVALSSEYFPKVNPVFIDLYNSLSGLPILESILSKNPTDYVLFIPAAPRYFISALKTAVSRSSLKTIYFKSSEDMDRAYLLLNSSYMYWWWRVRDGGMTLSYETIKSLPVLSFHVDQSLVERLENSEKTNIVYKKNAGALQENVKHNSKLIADLNLTIIPQYADKLMSTHENSEMIQLQFMK